MSSAGQSNGVLYGLNVNFTGSSPHTGVITADGQLLIGNAVFPNIRSGTLTSPNGTITIGYSAPNITLDLAGGTTAIDSIAVDASTPPGTNPVLPDGAGQVTFTGAQVAAGVVGTNVIRSNSVAANALRFEIQRSQAVATTTLADNGVCHFNSAHFSVDANGFVSSLGAGFPWIDQATSTTLAINTGYFVTGAATVTLPASPSQGDVVKIIVDTASSVVVTANTGQTIRQGTITSSSGGTFTNSSRGDTLNLVYRAATTQWIDQGSQGLWVAA